MTESDTAIDELVGERVNTHTPEPIGIDTLAAVLRGELPARQYRPWLDAFFGRRITPNEMARFLARHNIEYRSALSVYQTGVRHCVRDGRVEAWLRQQAGLAAERREGE